MSGQRGRYSVSATGTHPVQGVAGTLYWASGHLLDRNSPVGAEISLLNVLVICPSASTETSGLSDESGNIVTSIKFDFGTAPKNEHVEMYWNRKTDSVEIAGTTYDRAVGSYFVIVQDSGKISSWQLSSPTGATPDQLLDHARSELAEVNALSGIKF